MVLMAVQGVIVVIVQVCSNCYFHHCGQQLSHVVAVAIAVALVLVLLSRACGKLAVI